VTLASDDPVAVELVEAIHAGDTRSLQRLLDENPGLASARLGDGKGGSRTNAACRRGLARLLP